MTDILKIIEQRKEEAKRVKESGILNFNDNKSDDKKPENKNDDLVDMGTFPFGV